MEEGEEDEYEERSLFSRIPWKLLIFSSLAGYYYYYAHYVYEDFEKPLYEHLFEKMFGFMYKPNVEKFLPRDPPLHPSLARKTLIIGFEGLLYHKNYQMGSGIIIDLRPGLRDFLKEISRKYEIVLFSEEDSGFMEEVMATIDPYHQFLKYSFGREFFAVHQGRHQKDYDYFNRDFKKVVIVDFQENNTYNKRDNLVLISPYKGEEYDETLKNLKNFLKFAAAYPDMRKVIKDHGGTNAVEGFKNRLVERREKIQENQSWFSKMFGAKKNDKKGDDAENMKMAGFGFQQDNNDDW